MITNYSGQPFEPVYDMHMRTKAANVLYEEVETIRIAGQGDDCTFANISYGMLKATCDSEKLLNRLMRKLNNEYQGDARFEISASLSNKVAEFLPKAMGKPVMIDRLSRYPAMRHNITLGESNEFSDLKSLSQAVRPGLYLCKYHEIESTFRIKLVAESPSGSALARMMYSLKSDVYWKHAVIDYRDTREAYVTEHSADGASFSSVDEKLSQKEIDQRIAEMLSQMVL